AKTNFDAWRGAQPALQGKVRIRVLNFSSTCRLVDFFFEGAERGPPGRTRGISIKRVALYARPSGLISVKRGLVRVAISRPNALRSLTDLAFRLCLGCRGKHPALGLVLV